MNTVLLAMIALVGGEIHTGTGEVISAGTVLMDGQKIIAVGRDIQVPRGTQLIDTKEMILTPGLIDPYTRLGLVEVAGVPSSNDIDSGFNSPIRAAQRATDSLNLYSAVLPIQRSHGITTVLSVPRGGLISGQAALFNLTTSGLVQSQAAMAISLGGQNQGSRGARFLRLRQALHDARVLLKDGEAFRRNQLRRLSAGAMDLKALGPALKGDIPLLVRVNRRSDIEAILRIADEEKLRIILVGAQEAWQVASQLAARQVPVILDPSANLPHSFDAINTRADSPRLLLDAGVNIALSTMSAHHVRKLRQWAGNAVREGLTKQEALRAVTSAPAQMLGLKARGQLAAGMIGDVVIWGGDPFEFSTQIEAVYIGGEAQDLRNRQIELFERYRNMPP